MAKKKMRKNSFVEGAFIAYIAIIATKILGALYNIPFYNIIGDEGGVIYSYAYSIYVLFLELSTSGVPIAISIVISEYNSLGKYLTKEKAYKLGLKFVVAISFVAFALLQIFAEPIGHFFIGEMTGGVTIAEVASAIRAVSCCLLVVPFLSMKRGYFNGHKFIGPSSNSQVIEQFVRIVFVLAGSYVAIYILNLGLTTGVCVALFGAALGAMAAQMYLLYKASTNKEAFEHGECLEIEAESTKIILRKIFSYCLTIALVSTTMNIYCIVDLKMLLTGLSNIGMDDATVQLISSIYATWTPKITMIIYALALGLTNSIGPHIAESYAAGDMKMVNKKINLSMMTILTITIPMAAGIIIFAAPVYRVFYGNSIYGTNILMTFVFVEVIASLTTVVNMAQQSMNRGKNATLNTIIGVVVNASLDIPLIYLFHNIGIPAYLGAVASSIIGQSVSLTLSLTSLKRSLNFKYFDVFKVFTKILPATLAMVVVVVLAKFIMPVTEARNAVLIIQLAIFGLIGCLVYFTITYKNGVLSQVLGEEMVDKIMTKLKLKRI